MGPAELGTPDEAVFHVGTLRSGPMDMRAVQVDALRPDVPDPDSTWLLDLEARPQVVSQARRFVVEHAPPLTESTHDALILLTSELVTNAVVHARTALQVSITVSATFVLVTVFDLDLDRVEPPGDRNGGRGLGIVCALADSYDLVRHVEGGKTAWFRLRRDAGASAGAA